MIRKMLIQTLWEGKENKEKLIEFFDNNDEVDMVRDENLIATIRQLNEVYEWTQKIVEIEAPEKYLQ